MDYDTDKRKKEIGSRIVFLRSQLGLSQEEFSELIGVTRPFLGLVEAGKKALSRDNLIKAAQITGCSLDYLVLGKVTNPDPRLDLLNQQINDLPKRDRDFLINILQFHLNEHKKHLG